MLQFKNYIQSQFHREINQYIFLFPLGVSSSVAYFFLVSHPMSNPSESCVGPIFKTHPTSDDLHWQDLIATLGLGLHHLPLRLLQCPFGGSLFCFHASKMIFSSLGQIIPLLGAKLCTSQSFPSCHRCMLFLL